MPTFCFRFGRWATKVVHLFFCHMSEDADDSHAVSFTFSKKMKAAGLPRIRVEIFANFFSLRFGSLGFCAFLENVTVRGQVPSARVTDFSSVNTF